MYNICHRCNYAWSPRAENPIRCPSCKSTRWNIDEVSHTCQRCSFKWSQRGKTKPRYCPSCHSSMWNEKKVIYTCPKCGRSRTLKSNSRAGMCPFCDDYAENRPDPSSRTDTQIGLCRPIRVWSDKQGLVLYYYNNGSGIANLLEKGVIVGTTNLDFWFRTHSYTPEKAILNVNSPTMQNELSILVKQLYGSRNSHSSQAEKIVLIKQVTPQESEILALSESGMSPISISMKLGITFSDVMDALNKMPGNRTPGKIDKDKEKKPEKKMGYPGVNAKA